MSQETSPGTRWQKPPRVVSFVTPETYPQARTMVRSLRAHHPDWSIELAYVGAPPGQLGSEEATLVSAHEEVGIDPELLAFQPDMELTTQLVARLLLRRCDGLGPVLHVPATAWVVGPLDPLISPLTEHRVVLVPRMTDLPPDDGLAPTPGSVRRIGRIATDLIAVDASDRARGFLRWWADRLDKAFGTLDGSQPAQKPAERNWVHQSLELACARLEVATVEDGCNLSAWNLAEHKLVETPRGLMVDGKSPLRLLDLPGFEPTHPYRLNPQATRARLSTHPELRPLVIRYAEELCTSGWTDRSDQEEIDRTLANGLRFDKAIRALSNIAVRLGAAPANPFSREGTEALTDWMRGPAARGGAHGVNRYVLVRVLTERPDVVSAFPDLDGEDGSGLVSWCYTSGQSEMGIPDLLMPTVPSPPEVLTTDDEASPPAEEPPEAGATGQHVVVRVSGFLGHVLGLGAAARGYIEALEAAKVPTTSMTLSLDHLQPNLALASGYGRHVFTDRVGRGKHGFELICVNPDELPGFVERLGPGFFRGRRIGVWGWETNRIPDRWRPAFSLVDEVWVYSRFVADNLGAVVPVPVRTLPPPVTPPAEHDTFRLGVPDGFLFLFAFDYFSTIQRKNPIGLIEAFKQAFEPHEGPQLLIKTINAPRVPLDHEAVLWAADGRADIHVIDCSLSNAERDALLCSCDCYVSLHRSEGFGLTLAEAMALKKPVIATAYSGNIDFMNESNSFLVDYELTRVGPNCPIYPADGEWADPDVEHAAGLMRRLLERPEEAAAKAARGQIDVRTKLSPEATGAAMRRRLEELAVHRQDDR